MLVAFETFQSSYSKLLFAPLKPYMQPHYVYQVLFLKVISLLAIDMNSKPFLSTIYKFSLGGFLIIIPSNTTSNIFLVATLLEAKLGYHDVNIVSSNRWISSMIHTMIQSHLLSFLSIAVLIRGKYLPKYFWVISFHVVIEPNFRDVSQKSYVLFLSGNGNNLNMITLLFDPPLCLKV